MTQFAGRAKIRVDGKEYRTLKGASLNTGGIKRDAVSGYEVYGHKESEVMEPTVECKIPLGPDDDILAINAITDATIEYECDNGKKYMLVNAWSSEPAKLDDGEVECKFAALECKEV